MIPVRCFSCGAVVADKLETLESRTSNGESPADILNDLGVTRYCCRRMLLTTVETIQQVIPFYEAIQKRKEEVQSELE